MLEGLACLALAVYFEARGEPVAGQLAVAQVVINRARSDQVPRHTM
jgi:N-acetylmuramoyl-L-alanine amidase